MIRSWEDLRFFNSGEWQVVEERLDDLRVAGLSCCPAREDLFNALDLCPFSKCKVMVMGQDPYPQSEHAMGIAFSVPRLVKVLPPSLRIILDEYVHDLHYDPPMNGDLTDWAKQGVLLWNSIPSCTAGQSLSHDWPEWKCLTEEIIRELSSKGIVFALVGGHARKYAKSLKDLPNCRVLEVDHPSPLAMRTGKKPFTGSRLFTSINDLLNQIGLEPVDWRLQCKPKTTGKSRRQRLSDELLSAVKNEESTQ